MGVGVFVTMAVWAGPEKQTSERWITLIDKLLLILYTGHKIGYLNHKGGSETG